MIALYCRTSRPKKDKNGKPVEVDLGLAGQEQALRARLTGEMRTFADEAIPAAKHSRPAFDEMLALIDAGVIKTVAVYSISRIARSVKQLVAMEDRFKKAGVKFISLTESIDTSTAAGRLVFHILASVAEFESSVTSERTTIALAAAKASGVVLGSPSTLSDEDREVIKSERARGLTYREIAQKAGFTYGKVQRTLRVKA